MNGTYNGKEASILKNEVKLEQWGLLCEEAIKLKKLQPWNYIWDLDLIEIRLPDNEEPFFCSVMGKAGYNIAIGVYEGYEAINEFYYVAEKDDISPDQLIRYQNNLMCFFGDREELSRKDLKLIKDLGLKFRGRKEWIYFRHFETGYVPYYLNETQVTKLTQVFQQLYTALTELIQGKLKVDFENNYFLYRGYDLKKELWVTKEKEFNVPARQIPSTLIKDELLITRLKRLKQKLFKIELDTFYLNFSIEDKGFDKPFIANLLLIADRGAGVALDQKMLTPKDDIADEVLTMLVNLMMEMGKPAAIYVRDVYMAGLIFDLCRKLNIAINIEGSLDTIDSLCDEIMNNS